MVPCVWLAKIDFMIDMALIGPKYHISRGGALFDPPPLFQRSFYIIKLAKKWKMSKFILMGIHYRFLTSCIQCNHSFFWKINPWPLKVTLKVKVGLNSIFLHFLPLRVKNTKCTYNLWIYYYSRSFSDLKNGITLGNWSKSIWVINNYISSILQN